MQCLRRREHSLINLGMEQAVNQAKLHLHATSVRRPTEKAYNDHMAKVHPSDNLLVCLLPIWVSVQNKLVAASGQEGIYFLSFRLAKRWKVFHLLLHCDTGMGC